MKPRTRIGLIIGAIGLVLNICVAGFVGLCGPVLSLIAGGVAGFFAAQQEKLATKNEGAQAGAAAGGIAGGLIIIGQVIGAGIALFVMQTGGYQLPFGQVPSPASDPMTQITFYVSGIGTGICFGLVGTVLAAGAGAGAGYLGTPEHEHVISPDITG